VVIVPVPVRTQLYCSILDIQFEINVDVVQRQEQDKIDTVGVFMKKYPETTAVIEGHTDEVGSAADNMKLSQRRAEGVVNYLVNNSGIARSRLKAVGYGETRPIANPHTEEGRRLNRRIDAVIACATDIAGLKPTPGRITMAMEMEFDANKADVRPQYREELRKVADFMKAHPRVTATVEGHTGNLQMTPKQAMVISRLRARNVVHYLVDNFGIDRSRLTTEGFGRTRRFAYNTSAEGRQENRRVNIIFNYPK
jgi:OOP family OmpA-OmpF porin